jgi:hypothetical protein
VRREPAAAESRSVMTAHAPSTATAETVAAARLLLTQMGISLPISSLPTRGCRPSRR